MFVIGVDIGVHGGIALLHARFGPSIAPMPIGTIYVGQGKKRRKRLVISLDGLYTILRVYAYHPHESVHVFYESEAPYGVQGQHAYGRYLGWIEGICRTLGYARSPIRARDWQDVMLKGRNTDGPKARKAASIRVAHELFPEASLVPPGAKKDSDGMADALLIAEYGRRMLRGGGGDCNDRIKET